MCARVIFRTLSLHDPPNIAPLFYPKINKMKIYRPVLQVVIDIGAQFFFPDNDIAVRYIDIGP